LPQTAFDAAGVRELGRPAEAAETLVEDSLERAARQAQRAFIEFDAAGRRLGQQVFECQGEARVLLANRRRMAVIVLGHPLQDVLESGHAVARLIRKIGAAEERLVIIGVQEHGQRPTARMPSDQLLRDLIDLVQVRPLFAIDLDVHEPAVHQCGGRGVLEGLVRHDVAPVAGRIAHRQENRLVFPFRRRERCLAPGIPVDGVVGVLLEIRAGFLGEMIALHREGRVG